MESDIYEAGPSRSKGQEQLQPPKEVYLVVVAPGGPTNCRSLLLVTEYSRYLFNPSEGTQRFLEMHKCLKSGKTAGSGSLGNIFITHKSWQNVGGVLGLILTMTSMKPWESQSSFYQESKARRLQAQKMKSKEGKLQTLKMFMSKKEHQTKKKEVAQKSLVVTIHGPPGVDRTALMVHTFPTGDKVQIVKHEGIFKDSKVTITPIPFYNSDPASSSDESDVCSPGPSKRKKTSNFKQDVAYAYICSAQPIAPKINVTERAEVGVAMDRMVGRLQRGESVTLEDGTVIDQVIDISQSDDRPFLIIECPNLEFLDSLLTSKGIQPYLGHEGKKLAIVVHMSPCNVYNSSRYQQWMRRFDSGTHHLVMNEKAGEIDPTFVRDHQAKLNIVNPEVFPLLPEIEDAKCSIAKLDPGTVYRNKQEHHGKTVFATSGMYFRCRSSKDGVGFNIERDEHKCTEIQEKCLSMANVQTDITGLRDIVSSIDSDEEHLASYPKITFLGTGAAAPSALRAPSCILVQINKDCAMFLDTGEDSYGQLYRFFGRVETGRILRKTKLIFISHTHADHQLGLYTLLKKRESAFAETDEPFMPVHLSAPIEMKTWLDFYHNELKDVMGLYSFVRHQQSRPDYFDLTQSTFADIMKDLNFTEYTPIAV